MSQPKIITFHQFVEQLNKKFNQEPKEKKEVVEQQKHTGKKFKASKILNKKSI
jgi:hypothetical protein